MKNGKNTSVGSTKGSVGKKGVATAPHRVTTTVGTSKKLGRGPASPKAGNTTRKAHAKPPAPTKKPGLGPDSLKKAPAVVREMPTRTSASDLKVKLLNGDDGRLYYQFVADGEHIILSAPEVVGLHSRVYSELTKIRVLASSPSDKQMIKDKIDSPEADATIVATRYGYENSSQPTYFIYGDGSAIRATPKVKVVPRITGRPTSERAGDLEAYEHGLAAVLRDQAIPLTLFFFGLSQIIKPFAKAAGINAENTVMELVGESTKFKSALTCGLAASAWGSPDRHNGYALTWNITKQKIEDLFRDYNHQLLILDEVTMAGDTPKERGEAVAKVVHRLSSAVGRGVTGETASVHSLNMLSTSNEPLRNILGASQDVHGALGVRLISFEMPSRDTFFFDSVPKGYPSVGDAMTAAFAVIQQHYGLLARRLIKQVLSQVHRRYEDFLGDIRAAVEKFMKRIGLGKADMTALPYRRAQAFALSYATATIAFKTETLDKKLWGRVLKSILRAWNEHASSGSGDDGDARFNSYMNDKSHLFVDGRGKEKVELSNEAFTKIAGIFHFGKEKELLMAIPKSAIGKLKYPASVLKQLKKDGILKSGTNTLQRKLVLRRVGKTEQRDTYYVFRISGISSQARFFDGE